jgi:hypothetical protein
MNLQLKIGRLNRSTGPGGSGSRNVMVFVMKFLVRSRETAMGRLVRAFLALLTPALCRLVSVFPTLPTPAIFTMVEYY